MMMMMMQRGMKSGNDKWIGRGVNGSARGLFYASL